ncbi:MAG: S8 family serine peptidase [Thermoleophilia bacterium]
MEESVEGRAPPTLTVRRDGGETTMVRRDDQVAIGVEPEAAAVMVDRILADGLEPVWAQAWTGPGVMWLALGGRDQMEVVDQYRAEPGVWFAAPVYAPDGGPAEAAAPMGDVLIVMPAGGSAEDLIARVTGEGFDLDVEWSEVMAPLMRFVAQPGGRWGRALDMAETLMGDGSVRAADMDWVSMHPLQLTPPRAVSRWPRQWNLKAMGMPAAWDVTTGAAGVRVAVVDSGVDRAHPAIAASLLPQQQHVGITLRNGALAVSDDARFDPVPPPPALVDSRPHGTAVAGIIGAAIDGASKVAGIAPGVRVLPVGLRKMTDSTVALGIRLALIRGARVINLSITAASGDTGVDFALDVATANDAVVCAAAGNWDAETPDVAYPASRRDVLAVGAFTPDGGPMKPTAKEKWLSRSGPGLDVLAPGLDIATADPLGVEGYNPGGRGRRVTWYGDPYTGGDAGDADGDYLWCFLGTSAAVAHVSALVALLMSRCPGLGNDEIADVVRRTCDDAGSPLGAGIATTGRVDGVGWGRVNAARALGLAASMGRCEEMPDRDEDRQDEDLDVPVSRLIKDLLDSQGLPHETVDLPDVIALEGWAGTSSRAGWVRLYETDSFEDWFEFPEDGVAHVASIGAQGSKEHGKVRIWLHKGCDLKRVRTRWTEAGGDFLGGPISERASWDGAAKGDDDPWGTEPSTPCPCQGKTR